QLHQDPVHVLATIELVDETEQRIERDRLRQAMNLAVKAGFLRRLFLVSNIDDAGLVLARQNYVKARWAAMALAEPCRVLRNGAPNLFCDLFAVEYRRHVAGVAE